MLPNYKIESFRSLIIVYRFTSTWSISRFCLVQADETSLSRTKKSPLKMSLYSDQKKKLQ